jgi:hypothetical protein
MDKLIPLLIMDVPETLENPNTEPMVLSYQKGICTHFVEQIIQLFYFEN